MVAYARWLRCDPEVVVDAVGQVLVPNPENGTVSVFDCRTHGDQAHWVHDLAWEGGAP